MATLYITEFILLGGDVNGAKAQIAQTPPIAEQTVTFTTSTASAAFNANTQIIRVYSDAACHLAFGSAPTATTSSMPLAAGIVEYFAVSPGLKVAAVTA